MSNDKFDQLFMESGQKYGVDPAILKAIASVESSFRPNIRGPRTKYGQAQGMMQFIPATAKAYGLDDPMDPAKSVDAAARLMRDNIRMFKGDVGKALEAYNGGPKLVGKSKQTAQYRERVMQRSQYANLGETPTQVAQKPAPRTPSRAQPPSPPARVGGERVGLSALSTLPMNYQAALALQYLTDTDPEGNPEEQAEQALRDLEQSAQIEEQEQGPTLAQALASQSEAQEPEEPMPSPFEPLRRASKRQRETEKRRPLPSLAGITGFKKGGEARSDDYEDLAAQMTFGTLPEFAKDSKAVKEGLKESGRDIRRGIQYFPVDLAGAPVDIANMALTPFGLGSDKPFMGSDYLIEQGVKRGIYEKPSGSGVETLTRMAGLPTTALRSAMSAMQKGEEVLGKGIGLVKGDFPETAPEGAIRPRGGVIDPGTITEIGPRGNQVVGSDTWSFVQDAEKTQRGEPPQLSMTRVTAKMRDRDGLGRPITNEHRKQLEDFVNTKYAKYLRNDFGTEQDPLRQAFLSGKIYPPAAPGVERTLYGTVDDYLKAVESKNPSQGDLRKRADFYYDAATNINPVMLVRGKDFGLGVIDRLENDPDTYSLLKVLVGQRLKSLNLPNPIVDDYYKALDRTDFDTYKKLNEQGDIPSEIVELGSRYGDALAANVTKMSAEGATNIFSGRLKEPNMKILKEDEYNALDETLKRSVNKEIVFDMSEPTYLSELNPDRLMDTLSVVPPGKLANMDFAKAFEEGNKILSSLRNYEKGVGDVLANRSVPKEFLFTFTSPVAKSDNGQWVHLDNSRVNTVEGHLMKHSVGGYANNTAPYGLSGKVSGKEAFDSGQVEVFSLRNDKGVPMVTLEYGTVYNSGNPKYVEQIQGKFNSAPTEYIRDVLKLMKEKKLEFSSNRKLASKVNNYEVDRSGKPLKYIDKATGKEVIVHDVIDWTGLKKAYDADPNNFQVIKATRPEDTRDVLYKHTVYTTPERFAAANSETGPGGFVQLRAQGGLVSMKSIHDWV
jgi:hypothetical protein